MHYPDLDLSRLHYELDFATSLEGQVVAICDEIAQRTHDLEDGLRAQFVPLEEIRQVRLVRKVEKENALGSLLHENPFLYRNLIIRALIEALVTDVLTETSRRLKDYVARKGMGREFDEEIVAFSEAMDPLQAELDRFIDKEIIFTASIYRADDRAVSLLRLLFKRYVEDPSLLPDYLLQRLEVDGVPLSVERLSRGRESETLKKRLRRDPAFVRAVCDHIAGMTDNFALAEQERLGLLVEAEAKLAWDSLRWDETGA